jgi:hypothetical protein
MCPSTPRNVIGFSMHFRCSDESKEYLIFFRVSRARVRQGLLIVEASRSQLDLPHSVGLLWMSDQSDAEGCILQHTTLQETDIHAPGQIRTRNLRQRTAADPRLIPWGHRDRSVIYYTA